MSITYRKDVDGLRGLSILLVILFHAKIPGFSTGFIGVDIFFVISGFLITSIILKELNNDQFSLSGFYFRRAKRILPILMLVLLGVSLLAYFYMLPNDLIHFAKWLLASMLMLPNVEAWQVMGDYFSPSADYLPLLHLWSLGVEEQFYLFFPIFFLVLNKFFTNAKKLFFPISFVFLFFWLLALWGNLTHKGASFYLLPTRSWELLLGSLVAIVSMNSYWHKSFKLIVCFLIPSMILLSLIFFDQLSLYLFFKQNLACLFAAVVILVGDGVSIIEKILSNRYLVFFGLTSYSLYLWHWPLLSFLNYHEAGVSTGLSSRLIIILLSFLLAFVSWKYLEQPIRNINLLELKKWILSILVIPVSLLFYALVILFTNGLPSRLTVQQIVYANAAIDKNPLTIQCHYDENTIEPKPDLNNCIIGHRLAGNENIDFLIWGDSHANALTPALSKLGEVYKLQGLQVSYSGGSALLNVESLAWSEKSKNNYKFYIQNTLSFIKNEKIRNVFIINRSLYWSLDHSPYEKSQGAESTQILYSNNSYKTNDRNSVLRLGLDDLLKTLIAYDVTVWLVMPIPEVDRNPPMWLSRNITDQSDVWLISYPNRRRALDSMFMSFKSKYGDKIKLLNPEKYLCRNTDQKCIIASGGHSLYYDDDHLSTYGALYLREMLQPAFEKMSQDKVFRDK